VKSPVSPAAPAQSLLSLRDSWAAQCPQNWAPWSKFTRLSEPRWCFSDAQAEAQGLTESFAMIRLNDPALVINLAMIEALHLERFALEILAHAIGHLVYATADLTDNARRVARVRSGACPPRNTWRLSSPTSIPTCSLTTGSNAAPASVRPVCFKHG
jgi:hypothetical protein